MNNKPKNDLKVYLRHAKRWLKKSPAKSSTGPMPETAEPEWCIQCQRIDVYTPAVEDDMCEACAVEMRRFMGVLRP